MPTIDDFKFVPVFGDFTDDMFAKLASVAEVQTFKKDDVIFEKGKNADAMYIVRRGDVLLEEDINESITITLDSLKPGYLIGWTAALRKDSYSMRAVCAMPTELYVMDGEKIREMMQQDTNFGLHLMRAVFRIVRDRFVKRTDQFVALMRRHPDLQLTGK